MRPEEMTLFSALDGLGIAHRTHRHAPAFTVADAVNVRGEMPGGHAKNLLLTNGKGGYLFVIAEEHARLDIKALGQLSGLGRLSFAKPEALMAILGITPGSATPFALLHTQGLDPVPNLSIYLDKRLMEGAVVNFHPLHNEATTAIACADLLRFIRHTGYEPIMFECLEQDDARDDAPGRP